MVVNRKQPVAPVPLVQSRSTSQQQLVTRNKQSKHTANGIDVRHLVHQQMFLFFVLKQYHSLVNHLQRVQIRNRNQNQNRDHDRERFVFVLCHRSPKNLIYLVEISARQTLCLVSISLRPLLLLLLFSIYNNFSKITISSHMSRRIRL